LNDLTKNFDLIGRIRTSPGGIQLLESYNRNGILTDKHRNAVANVVADFYWENKPSKNGIEFQKLLAAKIVEVFPNESFVSIAGTKFKTIL
jgi:hypothetical protein